MVLVMHARTAVPSVTFTRTLPQGAVARRTVTDRAFKPRYFASAAPDRPSWELEQGERLWEIGGNVWWPFSSFQAPAHLDGSLPGDRGFDPFNLGTTWGFPPEWAKGSREEARLPWLLEGELYNGRVAMLAAVGILTVELQGKGPFWSIPSQLPRGGLEYIVPVVATHFVFAFAEKTRIENFGKVGEAGHFFLAPFDPLGLAQGEYGDYVRQAEVRNGRLAMLAVLGFAVQGWVTGVGPIEGAARHLADPLGYNIFTQGEKGLWVAGLFSLFSVWVHLAEVSRNKAASGGSSRPKTVSGSA